MMNRYGHGVLRNPDPRFIALQEFCDTRPELLESSLIQLVKKVIITTTQCSVVEVWMTDDCRNRLLR
jgi:citrate synthase